MLATAADIIGTILKSVITRFAAVVYIGFINMPVSKKKTGRCQQQAVLFYYLLEYSMSAVNEICTQICMDNR